MLPRRPLLLLGLLLLPASAAAQSPFGSQPPPPALPPLPPVALAPGVEPAGAGTWRIAFPPKGETLDPEQEAAVGRLGAVLATGSIGRVTLLAMAQGGDDASTQRRLSLARGLRVKAALIAGGLPETRIDIRPLGLTDPARDAVDILAPTAPRP